MSTPISVEMEGEMVRMEPKATIKSVSKYFVSFHHTSLGVFLFSKISAVPILIAVIGNNTRGVPC